MREQLFGSIHLFHWAFLGQCPAENELLNRHPRERSKGFDLAVLLWVDFYGQSVNTPKIVHLRNFVNA